MVKIDKSQGFTLIELMIVIVIIAVGTAMSVGLSGVVKKGRLTAQINSMLSSLNFARSEAIKRGQTVTLCSSADEATCAVSTDWETGWIVFEDINSDGVLNGNDALIRVAAPLTGGGNITLEYDGGTALLYRGNGRLRAPTGGGGVPMGKFTLTDASLSTGQEKKLVVSFSGRARVE